VLLLLVPGSDKVAAIDAEGHMALSILRALGLPEAVLGVQGCSSSGSGSGSSSRGKGVTGAGMKERSAARKRAEKVRACCALAPLARRARRCTRGAGKE